MKASPLAVIFAALGCGGVAAVAAFLVTPAALMALGYATHEMDLHEVHGSDWGISGGATVVTVPVAGFASACIGAVIGYLLTRETE